MSLTEVAEKTTTILLAGQIGASICGEKNPMRRLAYHEASHTVAGLIDGRCPVRVWISSDLRGMVVWKEDSDVEMTAAGTRPDVDKIASIIAVMDDAGESMDLDKVERVTARKLLDHWPLVAAVANALLDRLVGSERGELSGGEVRRFFEGGTE